MFWIILILLFSGCVSRPPSLPLNIPLAPSAPLEESTAFGKALALPPGSLDLERARIEYLLERIAKSPYNFLRDRNLYSGKRAEVHLRWKFLRNQKKAKTAEQFINAVATRSKISGEKYLVILPDKRRIPVRDFLIHELTSLDQKLEEARAPSV